MASSFSLRRNSHSLRGLVGARLDDGVHDRAIATAEFSTVGIGLDFELGDGIDRRLDHIGSAVEDVAQVRVVVDAVEQEVILQRAAPPALKPKVVSTRDPGSAGAMPVRAARVGRSCGV